MTAQPPVPGSQAWIEERRTYLGGADLADIAGVGFGDPFSVYQDKLGIGEPRRTSRRMRMGQLLEAGGATAYAEVRSEGEGRTVEVRRYRKRLPHPRYEFLGGNPDRWIVGEKGLVEVKTTMADDEYGEPGSDEVPKRVQVQCQWYLRLTGKAFIDVALVRGTAGVEIYTLRPDQAFGEALEELGVDFWTNHVEKRVPPDVDGSSGAREWIRKQFPRPHYLPAIATDEQWLAIRDMAELDAQIKALEARKDELGVRLAAAIADRAGLVAVMDGKRVAAMLPMQAGRVSWKAVADELAKFTPPELYALAVGKHTGAEKRAEHVRLDRNYRGLIGGLP